MSWLGPVFYTSSYWYKAFNQITPVLASLHWLLVSYRIHFKSLLIVFKRLNGLTPTWPFLRIVVHPCSHQNNEVDKPADFRWTKNPAQNQSCSEALGQSPNIRAAPPLTILKSPLNTCLFALLTQVEPDFDDLLNILFALLSRSLSLFLLPSSFYVHYSEPVKQWWLF